LIAFLLLTEDINTQHKQKHTLWDKMQYKDSYCNTQTNNAICKWRLDIKCARECAQKKKKNKRTWGKNETIVSVAPLVIHEKTFALLIVFNHGRKLFYEAFWAKYLFFVTKLYKKRGKGGRGGRIFFQKG
jgi:hypothetical protein